MMLRPVYIAKNTFPVVCFSCTSMLCAQQSSPPQVKFSNLIKWQYSNDTQTIPSTHPNCNSLENPIGYSISITDEISFNRQRKTPKSISKNLLFKSKTGVFKSSHSYQKKPRFLIRQTLKYGLFLETDPGESLSKPDLIRGYVKFQNTQKNNPIKQVVFGNYQIQLGEGLTKSNASGFWSSNTYWSSKLTDWQISEKRGYHEGRNPFGVAAEFKTKNWQLLFAIGHNSGDVSPQYLSQLLPQQSTNLIPIFQKDTQRHYFRSINLSGQHIDSLSLSKKHNLHEKQLSIAAKKQHHFLDTTYRLCRAYSFGMASHYSQFSMPYMWQQPSNRLSEIITAKQFVTNEIWLSTYFHQGDMGYAHFAIQSPLHPLPIPDSQQPNTFNANPNTSSSPSPKNKFAQHATFNQNLSRATAITAGWVIPLSKDDDVSLRYYRIGTNFQSWDGLNNHILRSTENLTISIQKTYAHARIQLFSPFYKKLTTQNYSNYWIWQPELKLSFPAATTQVSTSLKTQWNTKKANLPNWIFLQVIGDNYPNIEAYFSNNDNYSGDESVFDLNPGHGDLRYHFQFKSKVSTGQITLKIQAVQSQLLTSLFSESQTNHFLRISSPINQTTLQAIYQVSSGRIEKLGYEFGLQFFDCDNGIMVGGVQIISSNTLQFVKGKGLALNYAVKSKFQHKNQFGLHFQIVYQQVSITPVSGRIFVTLWQM